MAKAIREFCGKELLHKYVERLGSETERQGKLRIPFASAPVTETTDFDLLAKSYPWLHTEKLVVKPDQLIKRRGKLGLVKVNADLSEVREWVVSKMGEEVKVDVARGRLTNFIIEKFVPHNPAEEHYVCIMANRSGNTVLFHEEGGMDVGDIDSKAHRVQVDIEETLSEEQARLLVSHVSPEKQEPLVEFLQTLYRCFTDLYFTYLEINPIVVQGDVVHALDLAARLDSTAEFLCKAHWGNLCFPPPFGREAIPEEAYIAELDAKSGASLKLTVLNPLGRIWTMVAGGGASVIYSDTICDLGGGAELANYGEYSGAPSESQTFEYAKTILSLMTTEKRPDGKVLIIGGGIANFTNVAATFKGIVKALTEYRHQLLENRVRIFVRRGGPNYQEGLKLMREVGSKLGLEMYVFGPETHMTAIVGMALGHRPIPKPTKPEPPMSQNLLGKNLVASLSQSSSTNSMSELMDSGERSGSPKLSKRITVCLWDPEQENALKPPAMLFTSSSKAIVWGMQPRAVQGMLDFDNLCSREVPSVSAMVYPFSGNHKQKFYWGHKEIMIPMYKDISEAVKKHPEVDVLVNFASLRSAYDATIEALNLKHFRSVTIIAEGIPENKTKKLIKKADSLGVTIIGPATVGGIKPGCFKIGNTGGMLDNIIASKLYRPGR
ncbi:ATP-citrate synthase [Geodia barretti]|uniref:ATP citrate synthase n=2 Tax=Geodia barretti TaxID=519541 RepID=A0AA35QVE2_GEOBA|nr:ATP-citrate synthase [Geodia barretti]